ncbi:MAG: hypothetical protein IVW54_22565 [Candidatus Binataceae bacterium]|nr:hypothetical protein [Candidatus Binataceae bacterium]
MPDQTATIQWQTHLLNVALQLVRADNTLRNLAGLRATLEQSVSNPANDPRLATCQRPQEINEGEQAHLLDVVAETALRTDADRRANELAEAAERLAESTPADYSAQRRLEAELLEVPVPELDNLVEQARRQRASETRETPSDGATARESGATRLLKLVEQTNLELFHDPNQEAWATFPVDDHFENTRVNSATFGDWLSRLFYRETGGAISSENLKSAKGFLAAKAKWDGDETRVWLRTAECAGKYYIDLADERRRAIEISANGWTLIEKPPVKFTRPISSRSLPDPQGGGSIDELRPSLNLDDDGFELALGWMLAALRPASTYPILMLKGEQGSGKSTLSRILGALVDPREASLRGEPREVRDLIAAARNSWVVSFDNLSHLPQDLADAACRLSTGGGFGGRRLYTDDEEAIFEAGRPQLFNAIPDLGGSRPDFLDRAIVLELREPWLRRSESELLREFERARSHIFAGLLDAMVTGLCRNDSVRLSRLPRMADFARWATACERRPRRFIEAYENNQAAVVGLALSTWPVYESLRNLAARDGGFSGTIAQLLKRMNEIAAEDVKREPGWPKSAGWLSNALRQYAPNLRRVGIAVNFETRNAAGQVVSIRSTFARVIPTFDPPPGDDDDRTGAGSVGNVDNFHLSDGDSREIVDL